MVIEKIKKTISGFIKTSLSDQYTITGIIKDGENWNASAEVYEPDSFIQSIGKNTSAKEKNLYTFHLNDNLEVIGYKKTSAA